MIVVSFSAMSSGKTILLINPEAAHGVGDRQGCRIREALRSQNVDFEERPAHTPGDVLKEARRAAEMGVDTLAVCGGDGTLHWAANGLAGSETALAILGGGRGNDLARELGISSDPTRAAALLTERHVREMDLGKIGDRYFCTVATFGFDSAVTELANRPHKGIPNGLNYNYALLRCLLRFRPPQVTLETESYRHEGKIFLAATANTRYYGKGMMISPQAEPDSGSLQMTLIHEISRWKLAFLFPTVYRGKHLRYREVESLSAQFVEVRCEQPLSLFADGEYVGCAPFRIEVVPRALKVLVPGKQGE